VKLKWAGLILAGRFPGKIWAKASPGSFGAGFGAIC